MLSPLAASALFSELAKARIAAGAVDDAFASVGRIPNFAEKKSVLLHLALDAERDDRPDILLRAIRLMVEIDPKSQHVAGRTARSLLDGGKTGTALELIRTVEQPFDSDRGRYDFLAALLERAGESALDDARTLLETFREADYRDWGRLALAQSLARWNRRSEAEQIADAFSLPRRRSWALMELSRIASSPTLTGRSGDENKTAGLLRRAEAALDDVAVDAERAEPLSIQLRILGKAAFEAGCVEQARRIWERCEAAAASISVEPERLRARYFLAKVLREYGLIDSVHDYLDLRETERTELSAVDRSRVLQWAAEAETARKKAGNDRSRGDGSGLWIRAIEAAERETDEFRRAERIAEIVRRFAVSDRDFPPRNEPKLDAVLLSGEAFEAYYFSPFSLDDCGC